MHPSDEADTVGGTVGVNTQVQDGLRGGENRLENHFNPEFCCFPTDSGR